MAEALIAPFVYAGGARDAIVGGTCAHRGAGKRRSSTQWSRTPALAFDLARTLV